LGAVGRKDTTAAGMGETSLIRHTNNGKKDTTAAGIGETSLIRHTNNGKKRLHLMGVRRPRIGGHYCMNERGRNTMDSGGKKYTILIFPYDAFSFNNQIIFKKEKQS
jgi:hypothetical protein